MALLCPVRPNFECNLDHIQTRLAVTEARLAESEDLIEAIRTGGVDAVVVTGPQGEQVFTLEGAEYAYRALVEAMNEGAATLAADGTVLYCNQHLSTILRIPIERIIGQLSHQLFFDEKRRFGPLLDRALNGEAVKATLDLVDENGNAIPIRISLCRIKAAEPPTVSVVVSDLSDSRKWEEVLRSQSEQLRALAESVQIEREEERKRVARELHDQIGQILTAIKMDVTWMARHLPQSDHLMQQRLTGTIEMLNEGVQSVRQICSGLRPGVLDDLGLAAAIEWQANEFETRTGIRCSVSLAPREMEVKGDIATSIFRIFQESLTNVARHAEARSVHASLCEQNQNLLLVVEDDGRGFEQSAVSGSLGLLGMKERAQAFGGDVKVSSSPGSGTTVTVCVPLRLTGADHESHAHLDSR